MKLLSIIALGFLATFAHADHNSNPQPGHEDPFCILKSVGFTNGISFNANEAFDPKKFDYLINCPAMPLTTVVTPRTEDPGSTSEIFFNGAGINTKANSNAVSNAGNVFASPNTQSDELTFQAGMNKIVVGVSCNGLGEPPCYYEYTFTCNCAAPPQDPSVIGDPQFVGLRGQSFQVHGVSGEVYNIISDPMMQLNSRFVFLDSGKCPVLNGKKAKGCWSHAGSYLGEIGIKTRAGDKIKLISGNAENGFETVEVNGKRVDIGETVTLQDGAISLNSTHVATVQVGNWNIVYENSDMYVNQNVRVFDAKKLKSHGLLGQTWREATYPNAIKHIQGQVDDYVIREGDLFGDNFVYNMFN